MGNELKKIKELYGERMMHLCRKLFPIILEEEGLLLSILLKLFFPTRSLANDIIDNDMEDDFQNFIFTHTNIKYEKVKSDLTPYELLKIKGYELEECKTEEDIQKYMRYYDEKERLCTFKGGRLDSCYVFFAVRDDADRVKRHKNPRRQDDYGTSVISIQFLRGKNNIVSIKNRYNDTVRNADATFSANLDNIIQGLTDSFEKTYGFNINVNEKNYSDYFLIYDSKYVKASDGRYYRFNMVIDDVYYCENNIIIDHGKVITKYKEMPERYILMDYFILDLQEKKINLYDKNVRDGFIDSINDIGSFDKIIIEKDSDMKRIIIKYKDDKEVIITINKNNEIIKYENNYVKVIKDNFLKASNIKSLIMDNVLSIGNCCLEENTNLEEISLNNVHEIKDLMLFNNRGLSNISFPNLEIAGSCFLACNANLEVINMPNIKTMGPGCFQVKNLLNGKSIESYREYDVANKRL